MEPQADYSAFVKLGKDKQQEMINATKHEEAPVPNIPAIPDLNFIELVGIQDKKKIALATYRYEASSTKAVVIFFHSMALHTGLAGAYAKTFADNGITFVGFDQRGHGKSEGQRGYFDDSKEVLKDSFSFIRSVAKLYPNVPIFLMGHSLGGLMAITVARQMNDIKFSGIILAAPSIRKPTNKLVSMVSDVALKLMPNKTGMFEIKFDMATRNTNAASYLANDPQVYKGKIYSGSLRQLMNLMDELPDKKLSEATRCPTLIIQGQMDRVVNPAESINLYQKLSVKDKTFCWYPKMWNNLFVEQEAQDIQHRIVKWVLERAG